MRRTTLVCAFSAFGMSLLLGANAVPAPERQGQGHDNIRIHLKGFEEVPVVVHRSCRKRSSSTSTTRRHRSPTS